MQHPHVGWREWAWLPELDIGPINAKIDTGARTSALHAFDIHQQRGDVAFKVHTIQGNDEFYIETEAPFVEERLVKDSGGKQTLRPVISTTIELRGQKFESEITLVSRMDMAFRMLLGRSALRGRFLVDVERANIGGVPDEVR